MVSESLIWSWRTCSFTPFLVFSAQHSHDTHLQSVPSSVVLCLKPGVCDSWCSFPLNHASGLRAKHYEYVRLSGMFLDTSAPKLLVFFRCGSAQRTAPLDEPILCWCQPALAGQPRQRSHTKTLCLVAKTTPRKTLVSRQRWFYPSVASEGEDAGDRTAALGQPAAR